MWQSDYIEANGIKLFYTRTGGAKPPMVLSHGITDLGLCWTAVAEILAENYDVIMVDARGHGKSDAPETGYSWVDHAEDLQGVIQGLGLQKPIILGHSMGAMTALTLAGLYPESPRAILLEDPAPQWVNPSRATAPLSERRQGFLDRILALRDKSREELIELQHQAEPGWSQKELEPWADAKRSVSVKVVDLLTPEENNPVDWSSLLSQVTCPVLLITAEVYRGAIVTDEAVEQLKSLVPQVQVESVANAGHCIHRDQFTSSMDVIQAFLTDL